MSTNRSETTAEIVQWCRTYVGELLGVAPEHVDPDTSFDRLGLDSALAVSLLVEVEQRYGVDLPTETLFEHPNLRAVADHLHERLASRAA